MIPAADIFLEIDEADGADWAMENGDLKLDLGIRSTVFTSIFSDARLPEVSKTPEDFESDPRGVWFDTAGDRFGSLFWLIEREKITGALEIKARAWIAEALAWLEERGIARAVKVAVTRTQTNRLDITVVVERSDDLGWATMWQAELGAVVEAGVATVRLLTR